MLFHVSWEYIDFTETAQKRSMELFAKWQPGPAQFQAFYDFADRTGGFAIVEASSASDLTKTMAPWTPFLKFSARADPADSGIRRDRAGGGNLARIAIASSYAPLLTALCD